MTTPRNIGSLSAAEPNVYEALVMCDLERSLEAHDAPFAGTYLVLNTDLVQAALCSSSGTPTGITTRWVSDTYRAGDFFLAICADAGIQPPFQPQLRNELFDLLCAESAALRTWLRSRGTADSRIRPSGMPALSCSALCERFDRTHRPALEACLAEAEAQLAAQQQDTGDIRILLGGELAGFYPAEHLVRARYSSMPFLPNEDIVNLGGASAAVNAGHGAAALRSARNQRRCVREDISLLTCLSGPQGSLLENWQLLAKADTPYEELEQPAPDSGLRMLVCMADSLILRIGAAQQRISLSTALPEGRPPDTVCSMCRVYITAQEDELKLCLLPDGGTEPSYRFTIRTAEQGGQHE